MKIIAFSAWVKPEVFTRRNSRDAKRLAARIKNEDQKLTTVLTEKQFRDEYPHGVQNRVNLKA